MKVYEYSRCTTCKRAKKFLKENNIEAEFIEIKEETPTKKELQKILAEKNVDIKKLFNTSGIKYRELNLKDKLKEMTTEEKLNLLVSDGMLIKRPLVYDEKKHTYLIGFKEEEWQKSLLS
ncbi:arsenate reductase family protein [Gemelliphila asaccharolytica]|uniref:Transcriptional regulator, Spx/MgsR family n=1 Tax=Gemelliphila asaccharolytica TaxID=502393 RepID=A0ABR5TKP9_9BACL|nr:arsenate reductase family protein [Gemella asaccharolytica]KXB56293.1 transcriptional regulator, Spx/MgsR family [Gemella asaccharolytica]